MRLLLGDLGLDGVALGGDLFGRRLLALGRLLRHPVLEQHVGVAAELNVGAAAGHVGGDGHRAGNAGLGDDMRLLLVIAGVQHLVRDLVLLQELRQDFRFLDRGGADQHRLAALLRFLDQRDDGPVFLLRRAIDLVVLVVADHVHVGRHLDHVEAVDVHELVGLGRRRAGHAGELLVEAEIILEGDRGERLVLGLDGDVLLGLERLVQAFGVAAALHHAAGELVDDDHLVVLDDVVAVALEQRVGAQRLLHVVDDGDVLDVVERLALEHAGLGEKLLDMLVAGLGQGDDAGLLVELVVGLLELRDEGVDGVVKLGAVVERAGDDQRRARLVDQDRVHFVDDGEVVAALHHLVEPNTSYCRGDSRSRTRCWCRRSRRRHIPPCAARRSAHARCTPTVRPRNL